MNSEEIRSRFLKFFENRGHAVVPGVSLIPPAGDESSLFVSAGVQPLAKYILGEPHPLGKRLVNIQKCVRVQDIDEVGDNTHDTFFEMMGNWSFGDYFKEEAIKWSYELLTDKEEGFGLDPKRLYITVFEGNEDAPRDTEAFEIWKKYMPENRIYFMSAKSNWWSAGDNGPCGPDTEMFYDITGTLGDMTKEEYIKADEEQKVVEVWNDVFMEYEKKDGKVVGKLKNKNVDTGSGLERIAIAVQDKTSIFDTDLFDFAGNPSDKTGRIVADHMRTAVAIITDGVTPSNTGRGYVLRRLIRRAVAKNGKMGEVEKIAEKLTEDKKILDVLREETYKFSLTLDAGLKQIEKGIIDPFVLFSTYGFPIELTIEIAKEKGIKVDKQKFEEDFDRHREVSKVGSEQKFKGGLAGHSEMEVKLHTATHLLHQALHDVLGEGVMQKGSNITPERLRFDFSFPRKLTDDEKQKVEDIVNSKIEEALPVVKQVLPKEEALKSGARHFFNEKYPDEVSIYSIGSYSKEFCGGPHSENTSVLGKFKITKEEAISQGVRRIKAVLE